MRWPPCWMGAAEGRGSRSVSMKCSVCGLSCRTETALTLHVKREHGMDKGEYTWRHILKLDAPPTCAGDGCGRPVEWDNGRNRFKGHCSRSCYMGSPISRSFARGY